MRPHRLAGAIRRVEQKRLDVDELFPDVERAWALRCRGADSLVILVLILEFGL